MKRIPFWTALIALLLAIALLSPALADNTTPKRGDVITMGTYEQDGNTKNGAEPIEWMILDEKDDRLLVISVKALETMVYDDTMGLSSHIWWENCSLRKWLNKDFLSAAFSADEQKNILSTKLTTKDTHGTFETKDQLFCLSIADLRQYFPTNESMMCKGTEVAKKANGSVGESGNVCWWLRNILVSENWESMAYDSAAYVQNSPLYDINSKGCWLATRGVIAVRPAMWIRRDSIVASANATADASPTYETLQRGDSKDAVLALKKRLVELGYELRTWSNSISSHSDSETGLSYGDGTEAAVKSFQYVNSLNPTGIATKETQQLLFSDRAKKKPIRQLNEDITIGSQTIRLTSIKFAKSYPIGSTQMNSSNGVYLCCTAKVTNNSGYTIKPDKMITIEAFWNGSWEPTLPHPKKLRDYEFILWYGMGDGIKAGETLDIVFMSDFPKAAQSSGELYIRFDDGTKYVIR